MKIIIVLSLFLVMCGGSVVFAAQTRPLKLESGLIPEEYDLFSVQEPGKPLVNRRYLLAKTETSELKIRDSADFTRIVRAIASKDDALEFVRLLTSDQIRPFLTDVYYSEIHKKEESNHDHQQEEERWFAIEVEQYDAWNLQEPVLTEENDLYKIERFVASYPRIKEHKLTPAQLLKIWEWVDRQGKYSMEIQEVIAEGKAIHQILLFTK